jgi:hypothetical protein
MADDTGHDDTGHDDVEQDDDRIRFSLSGLKELSGKEAAIRFAAGAAASLVAALTSHLAGPGPAGPLLALPAILVASLTLVADDDGLRTAVDDSRGAVLGALGLVAFALVAAWQLGDRPTWQVLALATVAWAVVSGVLYGLQRLVLRGRDREQSPAPSG